MVPQQSNGFDCGVYTILFASVAVEAVAGGAGADPQSLVDEIVRAASSGITASSVTQYWQHCIDDIQMLAREYAKQKLP